MLDKLLQPEAACRGGGAYRAPLDPLAGFNGGSRYLLAVEIKDREWTKEIKRERRETEKNYSHNADNQKGFEGGAYYNNTIVHWL